MSGLENTTVTYCQDGKEHNPDPAVGTGIFFTESGMIADNAIDGAADDTLFDHSGYAISE